MFIQRRMLSSPYPASSSFPRKSDFGSLSYEFKHATLITIKQLLTEIISIFNPWAHSPLVPNAFSFVFFPCLDVFRSSFLFLCHRISLVFFSLLPKYQHPFACSSFSHSRWVPGLGLALVSSDLWSKRQSRGEIWIQLGPLTWQSSTQPLDQCAPRSKKL